MESKEFYWLCNFKSSRPEVFWRKGVLRNFAKFTGKHLCQSFFFNKVAGLGHTFPTELLWTTASGTFIGWPYIVIWGVPNNFFWKKNDKVSISWVQLNSPPMTPSYNLVQVLLQPKVDNANTWSLCPNCNVIHELREIYLCIRSRDTTKTKNKKNRGKSRTVLRNAMDVSDWIS